MFNASFEPAARRLYHLDKLMFTTPLGFEPWYLQHPAFTAPVELGNRSCLLVQYQR